MKWKKWEERLKWHIERKASFWASPLLCILLFCLPHSVLFLSHSSQFTIIALIYPSLSLSLTINASSSTCLCVSYHSLVISLDPASLFCFQSLQTFTRLTWKFLLYGDNSRVPKPACSLFTIPPFFSFSLFSSLHKSHPLFNLSSFRVLLK